MLHHVLQKMEEDQARLMIVFPFWPTHAWFTRLLEHLISPIMVVPQNSPVFLPWDTTKIHHLGERLQLCIVMLSGRVSDRINFHRNFLSSLHALFTEACNLDFQMMTKGYTQAEIDKLHQFS